MTRMTFLSSSCSASICSAVLRATIGLAAARACARVWQGWLRRARVHVCGRVGCGTRMWVAGLAAARAYVCVWRA
eukprot:1143797-Prymnesium_polylepis.1